MLSKLFNKSKVVDKAYVWIYFSFEKKKIIIIPTEYDGLYLASENKGEILDLTEENQEAIFNKINDYFDSFQILTEEVNLATSKRKFNPLILSKEKTQKSFQENYIFAMIKKESQGLDIKAYYQRFEKTPFIGISVYINHHSDLFYSLKEIEFTMSTLKNAKN